jgi:hypothetical protein
MVSKKTESYWLITVAREDCRGFTTIPIRKHPADYIAENARDSLICAIPISRSQFRAAWKAYENE